MFEIAETVHKADKDGVLYWELSFAPLALGERIGPIHLTDEQYERSVVPHGSGPWTWSEIEALGPPGDSG
ncbi:MAG: hypothetical protein ACXVBB_22485 [Isosphaeraceae bacterium]